MPESSRKEFLTTNRKALTINLDGLKYGTLAEIGAGQEVARFFFQAGGASKTIAKTMSAYDMAFSDAIYGKAPRYVSPERLQHMLDHEYHLLHERLSGLRGSSSQFFVFADTVATRNYKGTNEAHGWMGIRFQMEPLGATHEIILHVRMWDKEIVLQQQALGIIGVNLIYGAFHHHNRPQQFIQSLLDNLSYDRIEVDMLNFKGPAFAQTDNRLMSLLLVECGLTNAVMFGPDREVLQPSAVLQGKPLLVERGSFRPVTRINLDMMKCAAAQFASEPAVRDQEVVALMEITLNNLRTDGALDDADFLARVDLLGGLGFRVLVSNYSEYHRLVAYFRRYTREMIGFPMGISSLAEIFNEKYYEDLPGGILESFGRLFRHSVKLYIYPMQPEIFARFLHGDQRPGPEGALSFPAYAPGELITIGNLQVAPHLAHLYAHLAGNRYIENITGYDRSILGTFSRDVLRSLHEADSSWVGMVPAEVAEVIQRRGLFGYEPR